MENPSRELPRAMLISLLATIVIYVALAIGVFGTLTVDEVIAEGDTALAAAARPSLGEAGFTLMLLAASFSTASAINAQRLRWRGPYGETWRNDASFRPSSRTSLVLTAFAAS